MNISPYLEEHYYENQKNTIEGIPIDPVMREDFNKTPHKQRDPKELADWSLKPYIVTRTISEVLTNKIYEVWCLDGAELEGSTLFANFEDIERAIILAKREPTDYFILSDFFEQTK